MYQKKIAYVIWFIMLPFWAAAQQYIAPFYTDPQLFLVETKWIYFQTKHAESNTVIHQAGQNDANFLYFKIDHTYEQVNNGKSSRGVWNLKIRTLFFPFKNKNQFEVVLLNNLYLILQYTEPRGKGTFQYIFKWIESAKTPFAKPSYELPEVTVQEKPTRRRWWMPWRTNRKQEKNEEGNGILINVELIGGGYFGGIDPVSKDYITVSNEGRLIQEYQSARHGLIIKKKNISRKELEEFANFVIEQRFFDYKLIYDCETALCQKRKFSKPTPIPLRISLTYGNRRKVVTIPIWGMDERNIKYIDYPPSIDKIVDAIQRMAARL